MMAMRPSTAGRHLLAVELEEQSGSLCLAEEALHLFIGYGLATRVVLEAFANRGQVILDHRLIVQGGPWRGGAGGNLPVADGGTPGTASLARALVPAALPLGYAGHADLP